MNIFRKIFGIFKNNDIQDIEKERYGSFEVATGFGKSEFIAWAKMGTLQCRCPIKEPGLVHFNFGQTREQARRRLLSELGLKDKNDG